VTLTDTNIRVFCVDGRKRWHVGEFAIDRADPSDGLLYFPDAPPLWVFAEEFGKLNRKKRTRRADSSVEGAMVTRARRRTGGGDHKVDPRLEVLERTQQRARRGLELKRWGLKNRMTPLDPDSSLAADDANFLAEYAGDPVSGAVLFPAMNATDSLAAVGELIEWRPRSKNAHIAALLIACRAAAENAARTIWLLCDTDRQIRRSRCVRFENSELDNQRGFHKSERDWFDAHPEDRPTQAYKDFEEHVRLFDIRVEMLGKGLQATPRQTVAGNTEVVTIAAQWISDHPPAHDPEPWGERAPMLATRFYRLGSGFVHGYKWAMDYIQSGELDTFRMGAEAVGIAVGMTECAVALYEAQAQRHGSPTNRYQYYPPALEPTIRAWSALYV